ncbi:MAG: PD40 domain-containing protein [Candidatus Eisenbacteria bacterium]|nr:PD40 domain-containing protein [Candidatus Eisenbacteria bacterium]
MDGRPHFGSGDPAHDQRRLGEITPAWSPDGSRIVYSSNDSGTYDIWVRNLTSGETTQVTDYSEDEFDPTWNRMVTPWPLCVPRLEEPVTCG